ncbi:MAG: hypothetical protein IJ357_00200 [Oscillospiraceae bacterium]|nr:hypothetical protein [Oscillospiraceae bacterium]
MSLRDTWKKTGTDLGHAFRDLGKTLVKTVKTGAEKADNWANSEDYEEKKDTKVVDAEPIDTTSVNE